MTCQHCIHFKRRTASSGTCWLRAEAYPAKEAQTHPEASCDSWTSKTERAAAPVER